MSIPKEILAVKKPTNTVVIAYGKDKTTMALGSGSDDRNSYRRSVVGLKNLQYSLTNWESCN